MKLQRFEQLTVDGKPDGVTYHFWCPGCLQSHTFSTDRDRRPSWAFNGDMDKPTFSPSLLYPDKQPRCHLFLRDGRLEFCGDSGHALAGRTVDLPEIPEDMRW